MHNELRMATSDLADFLQAKLPDLSDQWWDKYVIDRLTFQQQRIVCEKNITNLRALDLAALLRVVDQNWYELSQKHSLPRETRNWIRELQAVRNKWAHMASEETPASEIYRDADTLGRFLTLIDANEKSIAAIQAVKNAALAKMTDRSNAAPVAETRNAVEERVTSKTRSPKLPSTKTLVLNRPLLRENLVGTKTKLDISTKGRRYLVAHDRLLEWVGANTGALKTRSWRERGLYSWPGPSREMAKFLESFKI